MGLGGGVAEEGGLVGGGLGTGDRGGSPGNECQKFGCFIGSSLELHMWLTDGFSVTYFGSLRGVHIHVN